MKYSFFVLISIFLTHTAWAKDFNLQKELSPSVNNKQVEVHTYKSEDDNATVTEYRSGGKVWMIKIQPAGDFPPYYLYDDEGKGVFKRHAADNAQPNPPMWVIKRF